MKVRQFTATKTIPSSERLLVHGFLTMLLAIAVALGSLLSGGCVAAPVALISSAAVTGAALVTEGERAVKDSDQRNSVVARDDSGVDEKPGGACPSHPEAGSEDQVGTLRHQQQRNASAGDTKDTDKPDEFGRPKT